MLCDTVPDRVELVLKDVVADTVLLGDDEEVSDMLELELELELCDKVAATLGLEDSVADTVVLLDAASVTLGLNDSVADTVNVRLEDTLTDMLELELRDGELEVTDPAPTATNAMFVD
jgi:hypothetical protein